MGLEHRLCRRYVLRCRLGILLAVRVERHRNGHGDGVRDAVASGLGDLQRALTQERVAPNEGEGDSAIASPHAHLDARIGGRLHPLRDTPRQGCGMEAESVVHLEPGLESPGRVGERDLRAEQRESRGRSAERGSHENLL